MPTKELASRPLRTFALVCVAVTSAFVIAMIVWYTNILSGKDWCATAIGASQDVLGIRPAAAMQSCFSLLDRQVAALALALLMLVGVIALCLLALMVIVVAGGHIAFKADKTGVSGNLGGGAAPPEVQAAQEVAGAAVDKADEITEEAKP